MMFGRHRRRRSQHDREWAQKWQQLSPEERRKWHRRGRRMFFRFLMIFGMIVLLIVGSMGMLAALINTWVSGEEGFTSTAILVWIGGLIVALSLPIIAFAIGGRAFRGIAAPLAEVMAAADAVAAGDLTTRVNGRYRGDFARLTESFNRMAEELQLSDQRRRNLTADVAHELRTPLHIIQGNLEGVLDEVYEPTTEHIEATLDETRLLARLVEDLRILSLAEAGQLPLHLEAVNVAELLADVETSFSGQAEAAELTLTVTAAPELIIQADYDRLTQVVNNLVLNAIRHTPPYGQITIEAKRMDDQVKLKICDTGEGIDEEALPYIFDRFWRGDKARPHTGSTGLGLAIARQLIHAHNGRIEVESERGQGTTFTIMLPLKVESEM